jgi:hypothetical protein
VVGAAHADAGGILNWGLPAATGPSTLAMNLIEDRVPKLPKKTGAEAPVPITTP